MEIAGYYPDIVIGCVVGSNFGGIAMPFLRDKYQARKRITLYSS